LLPRGIHFLLDLTHTCIGIPQDAALAVRHLAPPASIRRIVLDRVVVDAVMAIHERTDDLGTQDRSGEGASRHRRAATRAIPHTLDGIRQLFSVASEVLLNSAPRGRARSRAPAGFQLTLDRCRTKAAPGKLLLEPMRRSNLEARELTSAKLRGWGGGIAMRRTQKRETSAVAGRTQLAARVAPRESR